MTLEDVDEDTRLLLLNRREMCREDWFERVRCRREKRKILREKLGELRPKPTKIDLKVNECIRHPLGFLSLGGLGIQEMPRRPLKQARKFLKHISLQDNGLILITESDLEKRL